MSLFGGNFCHGDADIIRLACKNYTFRLVPLFWLEYCSPRSMYPSTNASVNVAMPSVVDLAKRELVKVLRELCEKYGRAQERSVSTAK